MDWTDGDLVEQLFRSGVSRRGFLKFCAAITATLALPPIYGPKIVAALSSPVRVPLIWLEGQDCAGNTEGFLRASHPTVADLILKNLSLDYHETIMAAAGDAAEASKAATMAAYPGGYVLVVEGSVPRAEGGVYCTVGGRTFQDILTQAAEHALAVIAVGTCAFDGGLPRADGGPTDAAGVQWMLPGKTVINLPGCPMNVQNLTATIVHYLTFKEFPAIDSSGRPYFAYGQLLHDQCERRAHFEQGEYVQAWGDEGHRKGWCLYKMGCKGPETFANCPTVRFNDATSWPVKVGHGCVGCTMPNFWDSMSPFYRRLPTPPPFGSEVTADQIGIGLVTAVAGLSVAHGVGSYARRRYDRHRLATAAAAAGAEQPVAAAVGAGEADTTPTAPNEETDR
jgi:hydrogenase small subunit